MRARASSAPATACQTRRSRTRSRYRSFHSRRASTYGLESLMADRESRSCATAMIATRGGPELQDEPNESVVSARAGSATCRPGRGRTVALSLSFGSRSVPDHFRCAGEIAVGQVLGMVRRGVNSCRTAPGTTLARRHSAQAAVGISRRCYREVLSVELPWVDDVIRARAGHVLLSLAVKRGEGHRRSSATARNLSESSESPGPRRR
jgi:hypothetical protein